MNFDLPESLYHVTCYETFLLNTDAANWFKTLDIKYRLDGRFETEPNNAYGYGYNVATLHIEDLKQAMLFKLTWL